ncbi:hypothetical protein [Pseudoalteromonas luteoviolacea]|uniref:Uncharacterized protein n=1 Tax=Pseudoalteromonas luteoviolacea S4054 TaxID=1129367 RepID=A0A0F6A7H2_9GAMM|nr:hypothetical protein [Pseudoalteromonas luteoviolacea]AOT07594.1 hypothetical protein S4054249_06950 [Pseudoalteromonas luteoviolacea]AOT12510.1 hypothetical protein S40542_06950 [Pseudoalteromonas luteoviolacea]AOT17424.1 hypothetical protein S4054_06950 [Pseudoalteromonas luteoviolacea]KKE81334.1 hypothetical protein N479_22625 [Pseudoalteromonas luteoviolacea S4054]KZN70657.1 hypothetical protein N481_20805 [Pseudoalteromonas luteoviolacea S4047-1]
MSNEVTNKLEFKLCESLPFKQLLQFESDKTVYLGTPFYGYPIFEFNKHIQLKNKILLDSNIFSNIRKNSNRDVIVPLLTQAGHMQAEISHIFAAAELFLNHSKPIDAIQEYYDSLEQNFNLSVPRQDRQAFIRLVTNVLPGISQNIETLQNWLIVAKYIYNRKTGLKKHVIELSELIKYNHLPIFSFIFHTVLVFFHVKENKHLYRREFYKKIQSDMAYRASLQEEIKSLNNVARDIALFMATTEIFYSFDDSINDFSWIASSDPTIGLILQEVCFAEITSIKKLINTNSYSTLNIPKVGLRPSGSSYKDLEPLISQYPPTEEFNTLSRQDSLALKKSRLAVLAQRLLSIRYEESS